MHGMRANIKAIDDSTPLLRNDAELRDVLQQGLRLRLGDGCELQSLRRSPSENRSSYSIELLELHCAEGRTLEVIFKDLSPSEMPELTRHFDKDGMRFQRALPSDQRVHAVDTRDVERRMPRESHLDRVAHPHSAFRLLEPHERWQCAVIRV